jgi:ribose/xylose/arabinose/galactoside ABC-type transport system permease subunit
MNEIKPSFGIKRQSMLIKKREFGVLLGLLILCIFFSVTTDKFASLENLLNILRQVSITGIMAVGMACIIVTGEIDLSVGSNYGMAAMFSGFLMMNGVNCFVATVIGLLMGTLIGCVNGFITTFAKVPSLITTLGMQYAARGIALIITSGGVINLMVPRLARINPSIPAFLSIGSGKLFGIIPNMAIFFIIISLLGYFVFHKTILGFKMKAIGGNANAAKVSGINVKAVKIIGFTIMGFLAALAGIINFSFLNSVQGTMGQGIEMDVIAAVIIGGASLSGGEASILGTVIGVLIMGVLKTGLVFLGVTSYLQMVFIGAVLIVAVAIDMWTKTKK